MKNSTNNNTRVSLREMTLQGVVDTTILDGWIKDRRVTILTILMNTAVYYFHGKVDRKYVEVLDEIEVERSSIKFLPTKEEFIPPNKRPKK